MSPKSIVALIGACVALIVVLVVFSGIVIWNSQGEYLYFQYMNGKQRVKMDAGPDFKWWATTDVYKQVVTVAVGRQKESGSAHVDSFRVQFSDFAKANMSGVVRIELPTTATQIIEIRRQYAGGYQHFVDNAVIPVVQNAFTLSANLRGAQEAAQTLGNLQQDIIDQLQNGMFVTKSETVYDTTFETNGSVKTPRYEKRIRNEILRDEHLLPLRTHHILMDLGCKVTSCQIDPPSFDEATEKTIQLRRQASLETEVAKQQAIKATQDAITAEANGRANAMTAKWIKEKEKAEAITVAEKIRDSLKLVNEGATYYKEAQIKEGEGEAEKQKLIMNANGNMELKLKAYVAVMTSWNENIPKYAGAWVPTVVNGASGQVTNGATQMMDMYSLKVARDLGLDMNILKK